MQMLNWLNPKCNLQAPTNRVIWASSPNTSSWTHILETEKITHYSQNTNKRSRGKGKALRGIPLDSTRTNGNHTRRCHKGIDQNIIRCYRNTTVLENLRRIWQRNCNRKRTTTTGDLLAYLSIEKHSVISIWFIYPWVDCSSPSPLHGPGISSRKCRSSFFSQIHYPYKISYVRSWKTNKSIPNWWKDFVFEKR